MRQSIFTPDLYSLVEVYEQVSHRQRKIIVEKRLKKKKTDEPGERFEINKINIFVKRGEDNPVIMYRGTVTDYEKREAVTLIDAIDGSKKLIIKIDKNDTVDITVLDSNDNIEDEFIVHGMQLRDIDEPDKLSIIKVEEVV